MTAVARPPRGMVGTHAAAGTTERDEYVGRHRRDGSRAQHAHAAAAALAIMLAWIPAASAGRGRHRG